MDSYHVDLNMDTVVAAVQTLFSMTTKKTPRFESQGGTPRESLALQNIQVCTAKHLYIMISKAS